LSIYKQPNIAKATKVKLELLPHQIGGIGLTVI